MRLLAHPGDRLRCAERDMNPPGARSAYRQRCFRTICCSARNTPKTLFCNNIPCTPDASEKSHHVVCDGIGARADALGGGLTGMTQALRESAQELIEKGIMQGYLAYEDGISIGWCNANDRQNYVRVGPFDPGRKRDEDYYISNGEHGKIKSLVCFEIAPEYRGKGIAKALLQRVCDDAEKDGYEFVEVYPQITEKYSVLDFTGPMEMYGHFGFQETDRHGKTVVMRKKCS